MYECYILNGEDSIEKAIGNIVNDLISAPRDDNGYSRLKAGTKGISANHELVGGCCLVRANNNNKKLHQQIIGNFSWCCSYGWKVILLMTKDVC